MRELRLRKLLSLAEGHIHGGRLLRAALIYSRVTEISQTGEFEHEFAHARLGDLRFGLGDFEGALPHLRVIRTLNKAEPLYALMLGRVLLELGKPEEAGFHLMDAIGSPFYTEEALMELARVASIMGDHEVAENLIERSRRDEAWNTGKAMSTLDVSKS